MHIDMSYCTMISTFTYLDLCKSPRPRFVQLQQASAQQTAIFFSNLSPPAMPSTAGPGWRQLGHPHRLALRLPAQHDVHGRMSMWPAGVQSLRNHQSPGAGDSHVGKNTQREGSRFKCRSLFVTMTGWLISYIIDLNRYIICIYMLHHM